MWGSDFRTFSTISKIRYFHKNIRKLINYKKIKNENSFFEMKNLLKKKLNNLVEDNNYISFKNSIYSIKINKKKGLTIDFFHGLLDRKTKNYLVPLNKELLKNLYLKMIFFYSLYHIR